MEITLFEKLSFYLRILFIGLVVVILAAVLIYTRTPAVRLMDERQKALNAAAEGDYEKAAATMQAAVDKYPELPAGHEALSQILLGWGQELIAEGEFAEGLEKLKAGADAYSTVQTADSAVRVILDATVPETASGAMNDAGCRELMQRCRMAQEAFDDVRLAEREKEILSVYIRSMIDEYGDKSAVLKIRDNLTQALESDREAVPFELDAYADVCAYYAAEKRRSVSEEDEPVEIYRQMNQAVYFLHQWAAWLDDEASAEAEALRTDTAADMHVKAAALSALASEYEIERAGLIVKSQEHIAAREAAEEALLSAGAKASFISFQLKYADHGARQYAIARAILDHSGYGEGSSVYQIRDGVNDDSTQTWLVEKDLSGGEYRQLVYSVDLSQQTIRQIQYRYTENGEEKQEERQTDPFAYTPYLGNEAFENYVAAVEERLYELLPGVIRAEETEEEGSEEETETAAGTETDAGTEMSGSEVTKPDDLWASFRYYTDGTAPDGETTVTGLAYYRAACLFEDRYHEFIVLADQNGGFDIREVSTENGQ
ncbi:MAG: hypothetical protein IJ930_08640 [Lachnospiraceae bacterium]|nr:hypothetical protein [Lachnospiraceae bacterium]